MTWDDVDAASPEMIIVSPCGYRLEESVELARSIPQDLDARVFAVDANAYFARPGPRLAEGVELLAHLFHPDRVQWNHAHVPWMEISQSHSSVQR
jgi:iron complex transport system substrate-binding protein